MAWKGGFDWQEGKTIPEMEDWLIGKKIPRWVHGITLHNTGVPGMRRAREIGHARYVRNCAGYYQKLGWSGGPHYFVSEERRVYRGTPMSFRGVHDPCNNGRHLGLEMIANFDGREDDDDYGPGLAVKETACELMAMLFRHFNLPATAFTLHKECRKTTHDCPGKDIDKNEIRAMVQGYMATGVYDIIEDGEHDANVIAGDEPRPLLKRGAKGDLVKELQTLLGGLTVDGDFGPKTENVVRAYQKAKGLVVDGLVGNQTWTALLPSAPPITAPEPPSVPPWEWPEPIFNDRPAWGVALFRHLGWSKEAAVAMIGTFQQEAYSDLRTEAVGDPHIPGGSIGLGQWNKSRKEDFLKWCNGANLSPIDFMANIRFADWELRNTEKTWGRMLAASQTVYSAALAAISYERPAGWSALYPQKGHGWRNRLNNAVALYERLP